MGTLKSWWPREPHPGNMGDIISPLILQKLFNKDLKWQNIKYYKDDILISTGSIINKATHQNVTVWGSGAMRESDGEKISPSSRILAVRGPVTFDILKSHGIKVPEIFGDPGLLLPQFFNPTIKKRYRMGIIPHYVDYEEIKKRYSMTPNIVVINVLDANPLIPIKKILECERTISSSLHGIIFSNAYKIPSAWVKFSKKLCGDDTKFKDYFAFCHQPFACTESDYIKPQDFDKLFFLTLNKSTYFNCDKLMGAFKDAYG